MPRITALLIVMVFAGAQASAVACELVCASSAAASSIASGCHADADGSGFRVTPALALCDHDAVGPWLNEVSQPAPKSGRVETASTADAVWTNPLPVDANNSTRWHRPESPPPPGSVRSPILRI